MALKPTKELGISGLKTYGGYVSEEFLPELRGREGLKQYQRMAANDATVGAILFAFRSLMRQVPWSILPADDSSAADDAREFVENTLFHAMDMGWPDILSEALTMLEFGFAPLEIVYRRQADGRMGIAKLALRAQESIERWEMDASGQWVGLWQSTETGHRAYIPADRLLLFRTTSDKNNPEGRSLLRNAWRCWKIKTRIEEIEGIGIERDLAGFPVVRIPGQLLDSQASPDERTAALSYTELAQNIKRDRQEGVVLPSDRTADGHLLYDVNLLSSPGSRQFDTSAIIDRYDRRIAMTVMADFLFLGQQAVGSFALSSSKTALFSAALGAFLDIIADQINRVLLPRLWRINGLPEATMPTLSHGDIETPDLQDLGAFISQLAGAGCQLFPDDVLENRLREIAGLPEAPEGDNEDDRMGIKDVVIDNNDLIEVDTGDE